MWRKQSEQFHPSHNISVVFGRLIGKCPELFFLHLLPSRLEGQSFYKAPFRQARRNPRQQLRHRTERCTCPPRTRQPCAAPPILALLLPRVRRGPFATFP